MAYLDLHLTPNRSLDREHARWVVLAVGGVLFLGGVRLLVLGAWPVIPFMAVDVGLLWWAFRASYRSGGAFETLRLDATALTVRRVSHRGVERRFDLEPYWTRAHLDRVSDLENRLVLACRGARVTVGSFLSPRERIELHGVIVAGLERCRNQR